MSIPNSRFNSESVWDIKLDLFDKYFRDKILKDRHPISNIPIQGTNDFIEDVKTLKEQFLQMKKT